MAMFKFIFNHRLNQTVIVSAFLAFNVSSGVLLENPVAHAAPPQAPISTGLPETLPLDILSRGRFVPFQELGTPMRPPLGAGFVLNGQAIPNQNRQKLEEVFGEEFFARIPPGTRIFPTTNRDRLEVWEYPAGTQIAHLISFRTDPIEIFEFRIQQKLPDERWAFGTYSPENGRLVLQKYVGFPNVSYFLRLANGKDAEISFKRINLQSCRHCHFHNSAGNHQYPSTDYAGPAGFVPANLELKSSWAERYLDQNGHFPF